MKEQSKIDVEVQKTMKVLDQLERAEGNPYLMTRLRARIAQEETAAPQGFRRLLPLLQIAAVGLLLLINVLTFQSMISDNTAQELSLTEKLANEYGWGEYANPSSLYDSQN
ncbi:MAG: hypothetical protein AAGG75_04770 [Bacteroidota bacterium]